MFLASALAVTLIGAQGSSDWQPIHTDPLTIAAKLDATLNALKSTRFAGKFSYEGPIGSGYLGAEAEVKSPSVYRIAFPKVGVDERDGLRWGKWVSNGRSVLTEFEKRHNEHDLSPTVKPFPGKRSLPGNVFETWFNDFARDMLSAIGTNNKPFTAFVRGAGNKGLSIECDQRMVDVYGHQIPYQRILVQNKVRSRQYEIDIQPKFMLPTTIHNRVKTGKQQYRSDLTGCQWDTSKNQSFEADDFRPKAGLP